MLARLMKMKREEIESSFNISGKKGKEGTTFLATDPANGHRYAIKLFKKKKSAKKINLEAELQQMAADEGVAPIIRGVSTTEKFIIMDALKETIVQKAKRENWKSLPYEYKAMLYALCIRLDAAGVVQNDGNPLNLMLDSNGRLYIIDYGFAKKITSKIKKDRGPQPNINLTLWHFSRQLRHYRLENDLINIVTSYTGDKKTNKTQNYAFKDHSLLADGEALLGKAAAARPVAKPRVAKPRVAKPRVAKPRVAKPRVKRRRATTPPSKTRPSTKNTFKKKTKKTATFKQHVKTLEGRIDARRRKRN
jgi:serine/threonine protein kinase